MDKPVSVTKMAHIEVGEYYWIRGTDSWGYPLPPQICLVKSLPKQNTLVGIPYVDAEVMAKVGDELLRYDTQLDLWSVNIKPHVRGFATGHGYHDRELVRVTHHAELKDFLGDESYREVMQQAKKNRAMEKPTIVKASKWGSFA